MNDDSSNLLAALHLREQLGHLPAQICVRMIEVTGLTALLESAVAPAPAVATIWPFGMGSRVFTERMLFGQDQAAFAEAIYNWHRKQATSATAGMRSWSRLDAMTQDDFRYQADHVAVKLRAIGRYLAASRTPHESDAIGDAEVEVMARMEYARECAARELDGRSAGLTGRVPSADTVIVDWKDLSEEAKQTRCELVRALPELLKKMDLAAVLSEPA
jgi:hypothetical protein